MSFFDILVVGFILISFITGFFGKSEKKIIKLIATVIAVVLTYFTFGGITEMLYTISIKSVSAKEFLFDKLSKFIVTLGLFDVANPELVIDRYVKIFVFCTESTSLIIINDLIVNLIFKLKKVSILDRVRGTALQSTAWKTFGLASAAKSVIVAFIFFLPLCAVSPIIKNIDNFTVISERVTSNFVVKAASKDLKNSYILQLTDRVFLIDGNRLFIYTDENGEENNAYKQIVDFSQADLEEIIREKLEEEIPEEVEETLEEETPVGPQEEVQEEGIQEEETSEEAVEEETVEETSEEDTSEIEDK